MGADPEAKRRKLGGKEDAAPGDDDRVIAQLVDEDGNATGSALDLPLNITQDQLKTLVNALLKNDDPLPYSFFIQDEEITDGLFELFSKQNCKREDTLSIVYRPQAVFRVRPVTRLSASIPGHTEAVLDVKFGPRENQMASASGDTTVRVWDTYTQSPKFTLKGHKSWVFRVEFSPDGVYLASGARDADVFVWDPKHGKLVAGPLKGHRQFVTDICWEPAHLAPTSKRFVSVSKDKTAKVWNVVTKKCEVSMAQHTASITCVKWSGENFIYTGSQDRTIKVWTPDGKMCRTLQGHAHWINRMALNTDYVLRTGAYDHTLKEPVDEAEARAMATERYQTVQTKHGERMVSCSDDFTMFLWDPSKDKKPMHRMTGHQQLVIDVKFSPDAHYIASASNDKSVRLWEGKDGKFITTFRGHVGAVHQVAWSADSRLVLSGSSDSTLKVWDMKKKKLKFDLPGHADAVYGVDWSPDGTKVVSGGKDKVLKLWRS